MPRRYFICLSDPKDRLARDSPVAQLWPDIGEKAPVIFYDLRPQRTVRDQRYEKAEIGAEAVLRLGRKIVETLNASILVLGEIAKADLGRLDRRIAVNDDRTAPGNPLDRRLQRGATGAFEDQFERSLRVLDARDDFGSAQPVEGFRPLRPTDDCRGPFTGT